MLNIVQIYKERVQTSITLSVLWLFHKIILICQYIEPVEISDPDFPIRMISFGKIQECLVFNIFQVDPVLGRIYIFKIYILCGDIFIYRLRFFGGKYMFFISFILIDY